MALEKALEQLPSVIEQFRVENEIKSYTIIKDDSKIVKAVSNDLNIFIDRPTKKKAIPGLRALMEIIEKDNLLDAYTISKIKSDFDLTKHNAKHMLN